MHSIQVTVTAASTFHAVHTKLPFRRSSMAHFSYDREVIFVLDQSITKRLGVCRHHGDYSGIAMSAQIQLSLTEGFFPLLQEPHLPKLSQFCKHSSVYTRGQVSIGTSVRNMLTFHIPDRHSYINVTFKCRPILRVVYRYCHYGSDQPSLVSCLKLWPVPDVSDEGIKPSIFLITCLWETFVSNPRQIIIRHMFTLMLQDITAL